MTKNPSLKSFSLLTKQGKILPLFLALTVLLFCLIPFFTPNVVIALDSLASVQKNPATGKIILSWTPFSGDLDGYTVYINGIKATADEYLDNSLDVSGALNAPGKYYFTVYTRFNGTATPYAGTEYDHYVELLNVDEVRLQEGNLFWDAVSGASGYNLYIEGIFFGSYSTCSAAVAKRFVKTKVYSISVVPFSSNEYYISPSENPVELAVSKTPAVGRLFLSVFNGSLTLSWSPVCGASSYRYTVLTEAEAASDSEKTLYSTTDTCISISSLVTDGNTNYVAAVSAFDGATGPPSTVCFKFLNGEVIPA